MEDAPNILMHFYILSKINEKLIIKLKWLRKIRGIYYSNLFINNVVWKKRTSNESESNIIGFWYFDFFIEI